MKRYITRHVSIAKLAALALTALCVLQAPVRAQEMTGYIVIFPSVGLAPGQSLRVTLFNPDGAPVHAEARIHDAGGNILLSDGSIRFVRPGTFHSFDFKRSDIPLAGEEDTGRIQLRASFQVTKAEPWETSDRFAVSMETISISDGTSNTVFLGEAFPSHAGGGGNDTIMSGFGNDPSIGIVPGQTLRITLFNPQSSGVDYVPSRVKLFDARGSLIAQSPELVIPSGESPSVDFTRDALPLPGEPGTGRLQVRIEIADNGTQSALPSDDLILTDVRSFEVIDNHTGKTQILSGHQCFWTRRAK